MYMNYFNQCIAVVIGDGVDGTFHSGPGKERVSKKAMKGCKSRGGKNCRVLFARCSEPIFERF